MNKTLAVVLIAMLFYGCAGSGKVVTPDVSADVSVEVERRVSRANGLFEAGEFGEAERAYQALLDDYGSKDGSFEAAVLTNICLAHLEAGERLRFKDCATRLREASGEIRYLPRETQLVLELDSTLGNHGSTQRDVRVETRIAEGLGSVLGKEGR